MKMVALTACAVSRALLRTVPTSHRPPAILPPAYARTKTVGMPVPSIEIKLRDVPEAGYYAARNPPQGEILIRGGSVTSGYFKVRTAPILPWMMG
jgi:acyl-CoA synthetase (AMP-forming)/AMP-acid ligase II